MKQPQRRERGTGTVLRRGDKWLARLRYRNEYDQPREKTFTADSEREAMKKLDEFRKALVKGEVAPNSDQRLTLGAFLQQLEETVYQEKLRPSTFSLYRLFRTRHCTELAPVPLSKLTPALIQKQISGRRTLSGQSRTHLRRYLIGSLNHAVRLGFLKSNPAQYTTAPLVVRHESRTLTKDEALSLLREVDNPLYKAMFATQMMLGLRIGEVLGLKWDDIQGEYIHIRQQIQRNRLTRQLSAQPLKTHESQRVLFLPEALRELINEVPNRGPFIFSTQNATPYEPRNAQRALYKYAKRAGLGAVSTHALRRTYATLSILAKTDLSLVSKMLGHTDVRTTMRYIGKDLEALKQASQNLTRMLDA